VDKICEGLLMNNVLLPIQSASVGDS